MIVGSGGAMGRTIVARFVVGEDLLESLTQVCKDEGIRNGIILTGFGSVSRAVASGADTDQFPPDKFYSIDRSEGIEILAISGIVADFHVHAHVSYCTKSDSFGGHLETGNIIFSLAEVAIAEVEGFRLKRLRDDVTGQRLLQVVDSYEGFPEEGESGSLHDVSTHIS
jgi:predicted DNA-binding protein with PD1-like motif